MMWKYEKKERFLCHWTSVQVIMETPKLLGYNFQTVVGIGKLHTHSHTHWWNYEKDIETKIQVLKEILVVIPDYKLYLCIWRINYDQFKYLLKQ